MNLGRNFDSNFDRFKVEPAGGQHATTQYIPNSFTKGVKVYPAKDRDASKEDKTPLCAPSWGRPLWSRELSKNVPPPTNYNVKREFDELSPKSKKKNEVKCTFGAHHKQYSKVSN